MNSFTKGIFVICKKTKMWQKEKQNKMPDAIVETLMMTAQTTAVVSKEVKNAKNDNNEPAVSSKGLPALKKKEDMPNNTSQTIPSPTSSNYNGNIQVNAPVDPMKMVGTTISKGLDVFGKKTRNNYCSKQ